jgi:transcription elongation factor Elf1
MPQRGGRWPRDRSRSRLYKERSRRWPPLFTCPTTLQQAPTGIETDVQSLQAAWKATLKIKCPHCGKMHEISVRDTYVNGALRV